jgi:prepilin-type N-terminal cleavage/methylation domain-containing protein/prepilin-type processing-associated H-X9-DG protein
MSKRDTPISDQAAYWRWVAACRAMAVPAGFTFRLLQASGRAARGFTLLELLVCVALIGVLCVLALTGVARSHQAAMVAPCLSNLRQLQVAWQMYADDFSGAAIPNGARRTSNAYRGYPDTWAGENNAAADLDDSLLAKGLFVRLGLIRGAGTFRCPADRATVTNGLLRTRSYSMDAYFAGRTNNVGIPIYRLHEVANPSLSFVLGDELEETIDDGHFFMPKSPTNHWVNMPADRHNRGAVFSFADGHAEHWRWQWRKRFVNGDGEYWMAPANEEDRRDLLRLQAALPDKL